METMKIDFAGIAKFRMSFSIDECEMIMQALTCTADQITATIRQLYKIHAEVATDEDIQLVEIYRAKLRKYNSLLEELRKYNDCLKKDASTSDGLVSQVQS